MREYKEWDENVLLGSAPTIQNVHKGDIIKAMENDGDVGRGTVPREYEVVEVYKRTVLTRDRKTDRKSTRLNSSHRCTSRMPSSA